MAPSFRFMVGAGKLDRLEGMDLQFPPFSGGAARKGRPEDRRRPGAIGGAEGEGPSSAID